MKRLLTSIRAHLVLAAWTGTLLLTQGTTAAEQAAPLVKDITELKQLNQAIQDMAERCVQATVSLISEQGGGAGSGVVVSEDGLILTAAHVMDAMKGTITVHFPDGTQRTARPLGGDFDRDAAMVQLIEPGPYPFVPVAKEEPRQANTWCVATGHAGGYDPRRPPPIRLGRTLRNSTFLITDTAVVGGDSGGPLFNAAGELIGIHSNIGISLSQNRHVPISVFHEQWTALRDGSRTGRRFAQKPPAPVNPERPVIGVQLGAPDEDGGVRLTGVMPHTPAAAAGILPSDILTQVNGEPAQSAEEFIKLVNVHQPGDTLTIGYRRDGKAHETPVTLARLGDLLAAQAPGKTEDPQPARSKGNTDTDDWPDIDPPEELPPASGGAKKPPADDPGDDWPDIDEEDSGKSRGTSNIPEAPDLSELLRKVRENGGRLEVTPEQLEEMGGMEDLMSRIQDLLQKGLGVDGAAPIEGGAAYVDPFFDSTLKALAPVTQPHEGATVEVLNNTKPVALGTVVDEQGRFLTLDDVTRNGKITVRSGSRTAVAHRLHRFPAHNLALFAIMDKTHRGATWPATDSPSRPGSILTALGPTATPLGIGLVSVGTRSLLPRGFLGVQSEGVDDGVKIVQTLPNTPAAEAGLKAGDIITAVNGEAVQQANFGLTVQRYPAGEEVTFSVRTGEKTKEVPVKLAKRGQMESGRFRMMNRMSGPLSKTASGFPAVIQHDIPLLPHHCGGPVVDLDGACVGINVARAGRIKTYAIPAPVIRELLASVPAAHMQAPPLPTDSLSADDVRAVRALIGEIRGKLDDLERRLDGAP